MFFFKRVKFKSTSHRKSNSKISRKRLRLFHKFFLPKSACFGLWCVSKLFWRGFLVRSYLGHLTYVLDYFMPHLHLPFTLQNKMTRRSIFYARSSPYKNIFFLKNGCKLSNVWSQQSAQSLGASHKSYSILVDKSFSLFLLSLPSGFSLKLGEGILLPDLYRKKHKKKRVRGIVKNPVDHPNGGSSRSRNPFFTPWGKVAKSGR